MRLVLTTALSSLALAAGVFVAMPESALAQTHRSACASGYHTDRGGNCQPNGGETNRYCPPGLVFHPTFDGWSCDLPPRRAY